MSTFFTLFVLITTTLSKTFICNDQYCDFGTCTNNKCEKNTYICNSQSTHCQLDCQSCTNITIISSAQDTEILCNSQNSCNQISINIQSNSPTNHDYNSLLLTCSHTSSCANIYISCNNNNNLCQCKDYDDISCYTNVNGDFSQWHSHPNIIRKSIQDFYNHSNGTITTSQTTTSVHNNTYVYVPDLTTDSFLDNNNHSDVKAATHFIIIMFGLLFCIIVCFGVYIYMKTFIIKCIKKIKMIDLSKQIKKETINSFSPRSQSNNLPVPTLGSSMGSITSIISVGSQTSFHSQLQSPKLNLQGSESVISVSSLNMSNDSKQYGQSMVMGV